MRITTELGELIRELRDARGITRNELAEQAGVSVSHLEKIEAGLRGPGMNTFIKIMLVLDVNINLHSTGMTTQEKCASRVQDIILGSEAEANHLGRCGRALELEPIYLKNELNYLVQMASIDGALMIDFDGMCYALGAILDGKASENSQRGRGARYNSGLAYVDTQHELGRSCLVVVISEDESIDILVRAV